MRGSWGFARREYGLDCSVSYVEPVIPTQPITNSLLVSIQKASLSELVSVSVSPRYHPCERILDFPEQPN
jgi:hypothetical protein